MKKFKDYFREVQIAQKVVYKLHDDEFEKFMRQYDKEIEDLLEKQGWKYDPVNIKLYYKGKEVEIDERIKEKLLNKNKSV